MSHVHKVTSSKNVRMKKKIFWQFLYNRLMMACRQKLLINLRYNNFLVRSTGLVRLRWNKNHFLIAHFFFSANTQFTSDLSMPAYSHAVRLDFWVKQILKIMMIKTQKKSVILQQDRLKTWPWIWICELSSLTRSLSVFLYMDIMMIRLHNLIS